MSTVKISELPEITHLNANTANTLFLGVDIPSGITGKMTATVLGHSLYSYVPLNVGNNEILLPNTIGQFAASSNNYVQVNLQNNSDDGTADYVVTANTGSDIIYYADLGFANKNYSNTSPYNSLGTALHPLDGYLYIQGNSGSPGGNLVLGTTSTNTRIVFIAEGSNTSNIIGTIDKTGLKFPSVDAEIKANVVTLNASITANNTATYGYANASYATGNASYATANASYSNSNAAYATANAGYATANAAFAKSNTALQNTTGIFAGSLTVTGNLIVNTANQSILSDRFTANTATFSNNVVILGTLTANTLLGNVFFSNISSTLSTSNAIQWYVQANDPAQTFGQVWYSSNNAALVIDTDITNDRPSVGKVIYERAYNNTGSTIAAGSWIRLQGSVTSNGVPYVVLADAASAANSAVLGYIKNPIANGAYGFAYTQGIVERANTIVYTNADNLFLSTTPGAAQNTAPTGANAVVQIAKVLNSSNTIGKLQISIQQAPAYGRTNGAVLYANNNIIQSSNTVFINETASTLSVLNGLSYTTRSYSGNQTSATINFTTDTWVRANIAANFAVTLGNFLAGSEIHLLVTNTSTGGGSTHTITHGCSAINSTVGATTFNLSGGTTARLKYYCFGSDLANTYVSISYS
jgi:hypothetical protein